MRSPDVVPVVVALACLFAVAGPASASQTDPSLVAVYPNPVADGDTGEFVVVSVPAGSDLDHLTLADDEGRVPLSNATGPPHPNTTRSTGTRRMTLSTDPNTTRRLLDRRVWSLPDGLRLANGGERLRLVRNGTVVDTLQYRNAPEGKRRDADGDWEPLGTTERPVVSDGSGRVTAFVLPDRPDVPLDVLRESEDRVLLAGYTLTSRQVADALVAAHERNVTVRVVVDAAPVGGMSRQQASVLDRLDRAGIEVSLLGGDRARYAFHHAKYAVVDDSAVVTTENWKPVGVGGNGSRGWGVVTRQPAIVRGLTETFRADTDWRDARSWQRVRGTVEPTESSPANGSYPSQFEPGQFEVERTSLLVAPDNAETRLVSLIGNASESLAIEQVSLGSKRQPLVRASLDAARRGVEVRILLSGAWYVREDNEQLVAWLNERASRENLPLEARIADPNGRYGKIHAKGLVVDGDQVAVGSLNWNNNSANRNREVVLVLEGGEVGEYFGRVFDADWRGGQWYLPIGLVVALAVVVVLAAARGRQIRFDR